MRIIRDSDTVEFMDGTDKLVLLVAPRQRDVFACDEIERTEAMAELDKLKASGVDTDKILADAQADPKMLEAAQEAAREGSSPKVRLARLKALAVRLVVDGESYGGKAIEEAYGNMDIVSAEWIDGKVASVWNNAIPSDADTRGACADDALSQEPAVSAARECPE